MGCAQVEWLLNGNPVVETDRLKLINNKRQLQIDRAKTSDTALYTCIATNEAGQLERNFDLEVQGLSTCLSPFFWPFVCRCVCVWSKHEFFLSDEH